MQFTMAKPFPTVFSTLRTPALYQPSVKRQTGQACAPEGNYGPVSCLKHMAGNLNINHNIFLLLHKVYNICDEVLLISLTPFCTISWTSGISISFIRCSQEIKFLQSFFCVSVFTAIRQHPFSYNLWGTKLNMTVLILLNNFVLIPAKVDKIHNKNYWWTERLSHKCQTIPQNRIQIISWNQFKLYRWKGGLALFLSLNLTENTIIFYALYKQRIQATCKEHIIKWESQKLSRTSKQFSRDS